MACQLRDIIFSNITDSSPDIHLFKHGSYTSSTDCSYGTMLYVRAGIVMLSSTALKAATTVSYRNQPRHFFGYFDTFLNLFRRI